MWKGDQSRSESVRLFFRYSVDFFEEIEMAAIAILNVQLRESTDMKAITRVHETIKAIVKGKGRKR